jgi:hypothetical protein
MPVPNDCSRFKNRSRRFDLDQNDRGNRHCNGRGCVHDNAQRAMVCVALNGMDVRYLDYGKQRQQDKTHNGKDRPGTWPGVELSAEISPKSGQETILHLKNTHNWMRRNPRG